LAAQVAASFLEPNMPVVYIANVSKFTHLFCYRANNQKDGKLIELTIERGTQIKLEEEQPVLDAIITRYQRFGMIDVKEVGRVKKFSGLMFQYEKQIDIDKLKEAVERKHDQEDERANEQRMIGVLGDQERAKLVAREVGLPEIKVTSEIEERQSTEGPSQRARQLKQKLSVDETGTRRRANA
jgi:hypothetical protein